MECKSEIPLTKRGKPFFLTKEERLHTWNVLIETSEKYFSTLKEKAVIPSWSKEASENFFSLFSFESPKTVAQVLSLTLEKMEQAQLHTAHPMYFGVFNPSVASLGFFADLITSLFNPQLASSVSAPFAIEVEQETLRRIATKIGYSSFQEGNFTTGGMEANHTAMLLALFRKCPNFLLEGLSTISQRPVCYTSCEGHHSISKAARLIGIGEKSVRKIPVNDKLQLDPVFLEKKIQSDLQEGYTPFLIVGTLGTTNAGVMDPIPPLVEIAEKFSLWLHLDAAWAGAVAVLPEFQSIFQGWKEADSLTIDTHKWFHMPMTAGMLFCKEQGNLEKIFRVQGTTYMPSSSQNVTDSFQPYAQSMGWSRRFLGLKVFMTLAQCGWSGLEETLRKEIKLGNHLRKRLLETGWAVVNESPFPVVCFYREELKTKENIESFAKILAEEGNAWITTTEIGNEKKPVLRAGITNFHTEEDHIEKLVSLLEKFLKKKNHKNSLLQK